MNADEWSIQQIAKIAGTTSRALRHYGDIGLLPASRIGPNGYRYYDQAALVRLQRILLLRELGLGLPQIADVLGREASEAHALESHLAWLRQEQDRLARQVASVESTITALRGGERLMAENMFDGFDHTQYKGEVEERWGKKAYADSDEAQAVARRHVEWLTGIPGTPAAGPGGDVRGYVIGLGEMYVSDPRFGANYATSAGGTAGAEFVRDALRVYAEANL